MLPTGPVRELATQGIVGGLSGTVVFLPQICLLFFLTSLLEDTGYLARAAFAMDGMVSRFGLPGQAFVPLLTAHACAVPGIMSTRLIPNRGRPSLRGVRLLALSRMFVHRMPSPRAVPTSCTASRATADAITLKATRAISGAIRNRHRAALAPSGMHTPSREQSVSTSPVR